MGLNPGSNVNSIEYITIASTGNAIDFGDLSFARRNLDGLVITNKRNFCWWRLSPTLRDNTIDYVTIASTGNALDFGDLTATADYLMVFKSYKRNISGGYISADQNIIEYITIASTGDAQDFGDLTSARRDFGSTASKTISRNFWWWWTKPITSKYNGVC